jgi:transcription termination factor Rho
LSAALIDTGTRTDEVIFGELKSTGNVEINLDERLVENTAASRGLSTFFELVTCPPSQ